MSFLLCFMHIRDRNQASHKSYYEAPTKTLRNNAQCNDPKSLILTLSRSLQTRGKMLKLALNLVSGELRLKFFIKLSWEPEWGREGRGAGHVWPLNSSLSLKTGSQTQNSIGIALSVLRVPEARIWTNTINLGYVIDNSNILKCLQLDHTLFEGRSFCLSRISPIALHMMLYTYEGINSYLLFIDWGLQLIAQIIIV